ncbi:hypothetical protein [Nitrospirillum amazonense]|uniref:Uncharacterized protein n=1 Tax=Nitrospirillum amazonense TaxID=28077 RepID=A0A560K2I8_9PROT|nr:hypothetical protein [Nitrospirillum amazonense]MDG3443999.1 hypothetical protein [Nitrospirillum amazonense]TWB77555.1 hypothetical protein FBZ87_103373 [Nitrospirillum amazonense]
MALFPRLVLALGVLVALAAGDMPARADFLPPARPGETDPIIQQVLNCWSYGHRPNAKGAGVGVGGQNLVCAHGEAKTTVMRDTIARITSVDAQTLVIWSQGGGDAQAAADLAQTIVDRGITVIIDGPCAGPCVWWLAAAPKRLVTPEAVFDFSAGPDAPPAVVERVRQATGIDLNALRQTGGPRQPRDEAALRALGLGVTQLPPIVAVRPTPT